MTDPRLADPSRSYAVLVGTHQYKSLDDLPAVEQNLAVLRALLCAPDLWGLPPEHCVALFQPDSSRHVAETLREAAEKATDTLIVYYAGHGLVDPHDDEFQLALPDSDAEHIPASTLPYDWVRREILQSRARQKMVVLDCCYSGRAMDLYMGGEQQAGDAVARSSQVNGACVLTAVAETKLALAPLGEDFTAFTGELIRALREGIPDGPELLSLDDLYRHTHAQLGSKSRPLPQIRSRNQGGQTPLVRNRAHPSARRSPHGSLPRARQEIQAPGEPQTSEEPSAYDGILGDLFVDDPARTPVRIGLWGAPASGKTTLLAALAHVVGDTQQGYGSWRISGTDRVAEEFLVQHKGVLMNNRFPPATEAAGEPLRFRFSGEPDEADGADGTDTDFVVEVQDLPGEYFHDQRVIDDVSLTQRLAASDGLVYLFDPTNERANASADYLFGIIQRLTTHLEESGHPSGRYLPHSLAVCVTKFDDPAVFRAARIARWGTQGDDRYRFPRVKDQHARQFFAWAAERFAGASGGRLRHLVENHFDPERTVYFVTSAIGFHVGADGVFDASDFANSSTNGMRIRGGVRPMNVLEPFIALERLIRLDAGVSR
ncbi:caspase family protein [Streptomyces sp. NPDC048751]|uniref:caspase, EACC1-associated type n=1 Tax=Streptomyces sp. NPDC048751 TaxID=3365591 RepID=UPI0037117138